MANDKRPTRRGDYLRLFADREDARRRMILRNQTARDGTVYCLVDGPEDNYAVVDLRTAIDLGGPYEWSAR